MNIRIGISLRLRNSYFSHPNEVPSYLHRKMRGMYTSREENEFVADYMLWILLDILNTFFKVLKKSLKELSPFMGKGYRQNFIYFIQ